MQVQALYIDVRVPPLRIEYLMHRFKVETELRLPLAGDYMAVRLRYDIWVDPYRHIHFFTQRIGRPLYLVELLLGFDVEKEYPGPDCVLYLIRSFLLF